MLAGCHIRVHPVCGPDVGYFTDVLFKNAITYRRSTVKKGSEPPPPKNKRLLRSYLNKGPLPKQIPVECFSGLSQEFLVRAPGHSPQSVIVFWSSFRCGGSSRTKFAPNAAILAQMCEWYSKDELASMGRPKSDQGEGKKRGEAVTVPSPNDQAWHVTCARVQSRPCGSAMEVGSKITILMRTVLRSSRGPCCQRDLRMQGIIC